MCSNAVLGSCLCVYFIYLVHASIVDVICNGKITIIFSERSRSLYAIACLSVVCLSSVTFVRSTQAVQIFGNISRH